ncbi:hypothetical protein M3231_15155 [Neobacillus mesonae]|nr:hypothetical protein [Neobacillus mesonae]
MTSIKYTSRYIELAFNVLGKEQKFKDGVYYARTPEEVEVLDRISDAVRVDEPQEEQTEETVEAQEAEEKPAKAPAKPRKANTSAK